MTKNLPANADRRHKFDPWVRMIHWRREWLPIPVFLPGKFHGQRSLASHSPWDHKESDKTEYTHTPTCTHTHTQTHKVILLFRHQPQVQVVTSLSCYKSEVPTTFFLGSINLLEWLIKLWKTYLLSRLLSFFFFKILKDRNQ